MPLIGHTIKSFTKFSFSLSVPAIPNHNSPHIFKIIGILIIQGRKLSWREIWCLCSSLLLAHWYQGNDVEMKETKLIDW